MTRLTRFTPKNIAVSLRKFLERAKPLPMEDPAHTLGKQLFKFLSDPEMLNTLLTRGANVDTRDEQGNTPLIIAASEGKLESCKLLIEDGADVNAYSKVGITPMVAASNNGHQELVDFLLEKGAKFRNSRIPI